MTNYDRGLTVTGELLRLTHVGDLPSDSPGARFLLRALSDQGMPVNKALQNLSDADSLATNINRNPEIEIVTEGSL